MSHSELPWREENNTIISDVVIVCDICGGLKEETMKANAALIVRAVNNHYQLLEALEKVGDELAFAVNHADLGAMYNRAKAVVEEARQAFKQAEES